MKKILYLVVCVMTLAACSNVQVMGYEKVDASENIVAETYNLKPFEKIDVKQGRRSIIMTRLLANPQYHISGFLVPSTHFSLACQSDLQFAFLEFH